MTFTEAELRKWVEEGWAEDLCETILNRASLKKSRRIHLRKHIIWGLNKARSMGNDYTSPVLTPPHEP